MLFQLNVSYFGMNESVKLDNTYQKAKHFTDYVNHEEF